MGRRGWACRSEYSEAHLKEAGVDMCSGKGVGKVNMGECSVLRSCRTLSDRKEWSSGLVLFWRVQSELTKPWGLCKWGILAYS